MAYGKASLSSLSNTSLSLSSGERVAVALHFSRGGPYDGLKGYEVWWLKGSVWNTLKCSFPFILNDLLSIVCIVDTHMLTVLPYSDLRKSIHIFPILLLEPGFKIEGGFVSFDLNNIPTTLKMQNIFYCETNKK
jgi:hypothetical protein